MVVFLSYDISCRELADAHGVALTAIELLLTGNWE